MMYSFPNVHIIYELVTTVFMSLLLGRFRNFYYKLLV